MAELGFFRQADANPDRIALVGPDGTEVTAGELAARANQVSHGLRAQGLERGDTVAVVMPNGIEMMELVLGAQQIGLYMTPINHHLVGPEIAYIVNDSDAKVLIGHERFADALVAAGEEIKLGHESLFKIGSIPGGRDYSELIDGQPTTRPEDRTAGAPMHYTSGTTGKPKGVKRKLADLDPVEGGALYSMFLMLFGVQPEDGNVHICGSPLYHTAVLLWATNSLHLGHKVVL
ncbi:MAG: long-chain acyl-CoA synthetase, partial [Acidimicrobiaceae bacterium]